MQSLVAQRRALQHAEPVLLVDDDQAELAGTRRRPARARACRRRDGSRRTRPRPAARAAPPSPSTPVSSATRNRDGCSSREMFTKCCSARISVGAMNATCSPFSIATSAASSATIVLPAPTSPCSSRFIGCGRCRSSTISFSACFWPFVSLNGSTRRAESRMRSSTRDRHRLLLRRRRLAPRQHAHLKQKRFLENQPPLRRRREAVQRVDRRIRGRKMRREQRRVARRQPQPRRGRLPAADPAARPAAAAARRTRAGAASSASRVPVFSYTGTIRPV